MVDFRLDFGRLVVTNATLIPQRASPVPVGETPSFLRRVPTTDMYFTVLYFFDTNKFVY